MAPFFFGRVSSGWNTVPKLKMPLKTHNLWHFPSFLSLFEPPLSSVFFRVLLVFFCSCGYQPSCLPPPPLPPRDPGVVSIDPAPAFVSSGLSQFKFSLLVVAFSVPLCFGHIGRGLSIPSLASSASLFVLFSSLLSVPHPLGRFFRPLLTRHHFSILHPPFLFHDRTSGKCLPRVFRPPSRYFRLSTEPSILARC